MTLGFFGKLPAQADFVGRGLAPAVQGFVDDWLAASLQRLKSSAPDAWLARYLDSPSWRFVWMADAAPPPLQGQRWAGVLLPSVDSVGRYFPLLLLASLDDCGLPALLSWLDALDALAGRALDEELQPDDLMAALQALPLPGELPTGLPGGLPNGLPNGLPTADINAMLVHEARAGWLAEHGGSCFWHCAAEAYQARLLRTEGLNADGLEQALFGLEGLQPNTMATTE